VPDHEDVVGGAEDGHVRVQRAGVGVIDPADRRPGAVGGPRPVVDRPRPLVVAPDDVDLVVQPDGDRGVDVLVGAGGDAFDGLPRAVLEAAVVDVPGTGAGLLVVPDDVDVAQGVAGDGGLQRAAAGAGRDLLERSPGAVLRLAAAVEDLVAVVEDDVQRPVGSAGDARPADV